MSKVVIPAQDAYYQIWIDRFATVAVANAAALGLTTGETTALTALSTAFGTAFADSEDFKATAKSKVATKDSARFASEQLFRNVAKTINANGNISNGLKADLGITITPSATPPIVTPSDLVVSGLDTGVNVIKWKRNGNSRTSTYIIECQLPGSTTWNLVTVCTKLTFNHIGQIPGQQVAYRVSASRSGIKSVPTVPVLAYPSSEVETFALKAA